VESLIEWLDSHAAFWPLFIFIARVLDVSIGTMRTILVVRGYRHLAPVLGFVEISIWVMAISGVLTHLDQWYNIVAYAAGFAAGNLVGITLDQKLAIGMQALRLISQTRSAAVAEGLRLAGYAVTEVKGRGISGDVSVSFVVVPRRETPTVVNIAKGVDTDVFMTIEDIRSSNFHVYRSAVPPTGWRAILKRK
jgi:uncharacterized protein YebE (UPF0316 family)